MKKVVFMLVSILLLTGCSGSKSDHLKNFKDYNSKKESYQLTGKMKLISNEDEFTYDIDVAVKDREYYKVTLKNTINNHEQVILKNTEGVYVVTPNLNKSFRFQSEWPNNSSQAYLLESLINDINGDNNAKITAEKELYKIDTKVNYPNNAKLDNETITTDNKFNIKKVEVKNEEGTVLLSVDIHNIDYNPKYQEDFFNLDTLVKEEKESEKEKTTTSKTKSTCNAENGDTKECTEQTTSSSTSTKTTNQETCMSTCKEDDTTCENKCKTENQTTKTTGSILEDIIYPLYVPTDTYLSSKDTVSTDNGNRVILTFAGSDPFILVEELSVRKDEMEIVPVSGEPLLFGGSIAALTSNSLYWCADGIDYYLTSNTLDSNEMMTIAESIANGSTLVAKTK